MFFKAQNPLSTSPFTAKKFSKQVCKHVHIKVNFQNMGYQCSLQTMFHAFPPHSKKVDDSRLKYR